MAHFINQSKSNHMDLSFLYAISEVDGSCIVNAELCVDCSTCRWMCPVLAINPDEGQG